MMRFIARRIGFMALIWVLIVFFVHVGMDMIGNSEHASPNYQFDQHMRYAWNATQRTISNLLRGDWGSARVERRTVAIRDVLGESYVNSMGLLGVALLFATAAGILIGCIAAIGSRPAIAYPMLTLTLLGISAPSFFVGLLLQVGEIAYLRTFGQRLVRIAGFGWDFEHMLLPVLVLSARPLAYLTRSTYVSLQHAMQEDYMRTAYAKGLSLPRAVLRHAARNMAVPTLTAVGVSFRFSLSTLPIVEFFFAWPGLGRTLLLAIDQRQTSMVVALASALGLTFLVINLVLDLLYRVVDPRTRER
jgi:peptide/nickel transport system permease protein